MIASQNAESTEASLNYIFERETDSESKTYYYFIITRDCKYFFIAFIISKNQCCNEIQQEYFHYRRCGRTDKYISNRQKPDTYLYHYGSPDCPHIDLTFYIQA